MIDSRIELLANNLVNYSVEVKEGDNVLIASTDLMPEVVEALVNAVHKAGGNPFVSYTASRISRALYQSQSDETIKPTPRSWERISKAYDVYLKNKVYLKKKEYI